MVRDATAKRSPSPVCLVVCPCVFLCVFLSISISIRASVCVFFVSVGNVLSTSAALTTHPCSTFPFYIRGVGYRSLSASVGVVARVRCFRRQAGTRRGGWGQRGERAGRFDRETSIAVPLFGFGCFQLEAAGLMVGDARAARGRSCVETLLERPSIVRLILGAVWASGWGLDPMRSRNDTWVVRYSSCRGWLQRRSRVEGCGGCGLYGHFTCRGLA